MTATPHNPKPLLCIRVYSNIPDYIVIHIITQIKPPLSQDNEF